MAQTGEEKNDLKDPLKTFIDFIVKIAEWQENKLPSTQAEEAAKILEAKIKDLNKSYCSDCDTELILNTRLNRSGKRAEMHGTSYCPNCKITNRYRRFIN